MSGSDKNKGSLMNMLRQVNFDLKQNKVINGPPPSLKYLTLSKIATSLWKGQIEIVKTNDLLNAFSWERKVLHNIRSLMIPEKNKEDLNQIVKSIGTEMTNNFLVQKLTCFDKLNVYLNNLCWNQQGTLNPLKTAVKIIEDRNLSTLEKFELACDFCLMDNIRDLQKRLSKSEIERLGNMEPFSLTKLWPLYINNNETLPILIEGIPALDYLLCCLKHTYENKIAIQYIWDNFADETWKEQLENMFLEVRSFRNPSIALYFFKQMNRSQLRKTSYDIHESLLRKLHNISTWNSGFSLLNFCLEIIKTRNDALLAFRLVRFCWRYIFPNCDDCVIIYIEFVLRFIIHLERNLTYFYRQHTSIIVGNAYKQGLFIKLFLDSVSYEDRKSLIYSCDTMIFCRRLLYEEEEDLELLFRAQPFKDGLESFDIFINLILEEKEISEFKKKFFQVEKLNICSKLIIEENYKLLEKILIAFCTRETLSEFKKKYCINILNSLTMEVESRNLNLLSIVTHFIGWCLDDNKDEIARYKAFVFNLNSNLEDSRTNYLITLWGKWTLVRKYWRRILCTDENKESFSYSKKNNQRLLKRIITSCFNPIEIFDLQKELRQNVELLLQVKELIEQKDFSEMKGFLNWCFCFDEDKIYYFKTKFMNAFGCSLLFQFIEDDDIEEVKSILSWFNPSVESAKLFRDIFTNFISREKQINLNNGGIDRKESSIKEKNKLIKRIYECLELLNCYSKENCVLDKENIAPSEHSKKNKITEIKKINLVRYKKLMDDL